MPGHETSAVTDASRICGNRDSVGTSVVSPVRTSGDVRFEIVPSNRTASSSCSEMGGYFSGSL